ncbi:kinesin-like protein KIF3C [Sceloporus undulatus]|uniref:kinesin-like protein KIF3C n=1 Tax=Sceloporus undulatus TaxID=8520 RepID=UPI001C4B6523|nr:kinesin-like protein KIF3C [Sceloporus undulatus]
MSSSPSPGRPSPSAGAESVRVVVRCRPLSRWEEASGAERVVFVDGRLGQVSLLRQPPPPPPQPPQAQHPPPPPPTAKTFTFDAAFEGAGREGELYEEAARPVVEAALRGVNGTLLCYGQTGTGKTYTMQGPPEEGQAEQRGLLPRAFEHLFTAIARSGPQQRYLVRASYLEIYQEEVRDLLAAAGPRRVELKESPEAGVYLKGLASFVTKDLREIEHVRRRGNLARAIGATQLNQRSSRSHAIFLVTVECSQAGPDGQEHIRVGKLHLVDLAGSERQGKASSAGPRGPANAPDQRQPHRQASKINLSLSALGNVISALVDGRSTHVPYRDSKLTRLLQDSLGGNAKTVLVATLGPAAHSYEETLSTLRFAARAKNIKNKPRVNEDPKDTLLREFQEEIARLKAQLEKRGMLGKRRHHRPRAGQRHGLKRAPGEEEEEEEEEEDSNNRGEETPGVEETPPRVEREEMLGGLDKNVETYLKAQKERLEEEKAAIQDDHSLVSEEKARLLEEKERMLQELRQERQATERLAIKYKAMESKLLIGGRNIMDHTNEQQKMLELKRQEIAEQKRREREMQQQVLLRDEETMELRETFTSLQQEVEIKTKKLKKLYAKLQAVKAEIQDQHDEYIRVRQDLEEAQNEQTRELKLKYLIIENFIPPEEKNKIMNRLYFDCEEDQWKFQPLVLSVGSNSGISISSANTGTQMKKRPTSAVGYKRPISQYARLAMSMGSHPRYRAENIMFLELDISPPAIFEFEITCDQNEHDPRARHLERLMRLDSLMERPAASRVRKSRSWCQTPRSLPSSTTHVSLAYSSQNPSTAPAHQ